MARRIRILLLTVVMALLGLTTTAWAGTDFAKAPKANTLLQKAAQCPGGNCGKNCQLKNWLNQNAGDQKVFARSDCNGYLGDATMLGNCKKAVAKVPEEYTCTGTVVAKVPCALLGEKVSKKDATPDKCSCPAGTHETADKSHCECDESELAGKFVVAGQNVDKTCMTKAELAAAQKRRDDEKDRLAKLKRQKDREDREKAKAWNPWHQARLHPDEDGYYDTCPADISEKVECKTPDFADYVCLCKNCPDYLRDELTPNDPWVLKKGERESCPEWFDYLLATIGWLGVIGIPLFLIALIILIIFLVRRKKKDKKKGGGTSAPAGPTGTSTGDPTLPPDGEVPPPSPVDAQSLEVLELNLTDKFISSGEGGFLHPEHPFMKSMVAVFSAVFTTKTQFDALKDEPPEPLLEAFIAKIKPDLIREQNRELFMDIMAEYNRLIEELTKQIEALKAQGSADPVQLQTLEIERRVYQGCLEDVKRRDKLLAGIDDEDDN